MSFIDHPNTDVSEYRKFEESLKPMESERWNCYIGSMTYVNFPAKNTLSSSRNQIKVFLESLGYKFETKFLPTEPVCYDDMPDLITPTDDDMPDLITPTDDESQKSCLKRKFEDDTVSSNKK